MGAGYLDRLDAKLTAGVARLSDAFATRRASYISSQQMPDGGFCGRAGGSDLYYADFALRTLALLGAPADVAARAASYLGTLAASPKTVVESFCWLNCARMLRRLGVPVHIDVESLLGPLQVPPAGAYDAFLGALSYEVIGREMPGRTAVVAAVAKLEQPGGGFGEQRGAPVAQTNATAAAVAFLRMSDALEAGAAGRAAQFLYTMQTAAGGFLAHAAAPEPDLLSTFTALVTLIDLDAADNADLSATARFVRDLAHPGGGFRSSPSDAETDVEYAYYGVAAVALLKEHASRGHG